MARGDFDHDRDVYQPIWHLLRRVLSTWSIRVAPLPAPEEPDDS